MRAQFRLRLGHQQLITRCAKGEQEASQSQAFMLKLTWTGRSACTAQAAAWPQAARRRARGRASASWRPGSSLPFPCVLLRRCAAHTPRALSCWPWQGPAHAAERRLLASWPCSWQHLPVPICGDKCSQGSRCNLQGANRAEGTRNQTAKTKVDRDEKKMKYLENESSLPAHLLLLRPGDGCHLDPCLRSRRLTCSQMSK